MHGQNHIKHSMKVREEREEGIKGRKKEHGK
jgi:hypothetical protein